MANRNIECGDMNLVNAIEYKRHVEHDWYEDGDTCTLYDIEAYDYDENNILWTIDDVEQGELPELVGPEVAEMIINSKPDQERLTDIMSTSVNDLTNVDEVNAMAKRIFPVESYEGNERGYILTDGSFIRFGGGMDHLSITRIDGMKIGAFVSLGNIRVHYNSFELAKEPTTAQRQMLRYLIANSPDGEVYVDIIAETTTHYGNVLTAAKYRTRNPRIVLNQLDRWFAEHIKLQDYNGDMYESKKVMFDGNAITESALRGIVREAFAEILTENRMSKNMSKARNYIRSQFPSLNPQEVLDMVRRDIPNSRIADGKFLMGISRLYIQNELGNDAVVAEFNKTLKLIGSDTHVNEYDNNLNGMDVESLINKFATSVQGELETRKRDVDSEQYTANKSYRIVPINSYEEAKKYNQYTDWCVTEDEYMYDSYTNQGSGRFYFCLKDGFQEVEKKEGSNCPLDEYGLSMIAVSVNEDGSCNSITCRWNHDNDGDDNVMTDKELSRLIGCNFYQTFKPWTEKELRERGIITVALAQELIKKGEKTPEEIFDIVCKESEGWRRIMFRGRTSFINGQNEFIGNGKLWFDLAGDFKNGMCWVTKNMLCTYMDTNGHLMGNGQKWFGNCHPFYSPNYAAVSLKDKGSAIITRDGEFALGDVWFDNISPIASSRKDYYIIDKQDEHAFMRCDNLMITKDSQGNDVWWKSCPNGFKDGYAIINNDHKVAVVSRATNRLIADDMWFDNVNPPHCGFMTVLLRDRGYSYIDLNTGHLIGDNGKIWFDYASDFYSDSQRAYVQLKGRDECCFMDKNFNLYNENTGEPIGNLFNNH